MKSYLSLGLLLFVASVVGCGSPASSIPTSTTPADAQAVEQSQQKAAQEEMAQQTK